ncbi:MAG: VirB3 family type IV secretion system protein [Acidiferrobacteraceae bacterium]
MNRPLLILGGERNLVLMLGVIAGVFVFSLAQFWAFVTGIGLWVGGQWALA